MKFIINAFGKEKGDVTYYADDVEMFKIFADDAVKNGKIISIEAEYIREIPASVAKIAKEYGVPVTEIKEQPAIELSEDDEPEFIGQLIDVFEDFLDEKGITIENEEREGDEDDAIIYVSDYDEIADGIREIISRWISK
jgi:hypothetical protein